MPSTSPRFHAVLGVPSPLRIASALALLALFVPFVSRAACTNLPAEFSIQPGNSVHFFGDSVSDQFPEKADHYVHIVRHVLQASYCDGSTLTLTAEGRKSGHWRNYRRRVTKRFTANAFDAVVFQDAGKGLRRSKDRFRDGVLQTVEKTRAAAPGMAIFLATTPPLDRQHSVVKWIKHYTQFSDFILHNDDLRSFESEFGFTILDWSRDACIAYAAGPLLPWTLDGVHPDSHAELLHALATIRGWGAPRDDLVFTGLDSLNAAFSEELADTVADWIYAPSAVCPQ